MSPLLPVADVERSIEFYTKKLGFSLDFNYEDFYAGIVKDGHSIHLKAAPLRGTMEKTRKTLTLFFLWAALNANTKRF